MTSSAEIAVSAVGVQDLTPADLAAWRALQTGEPEMGSPYLSPDWPILLAGLDGPDSRGARVVVLRREGAPVGFFPARVVGSTALPLGAPFCDYQALVAEPGLSIDPRRIVKALGVSRLDLQYAIASQPVFAAHFRTHAHSWVVDVSRGFDAYSTERRSAGTDVVKDCAKKRRKLEREIAPVTFTALSTDQAAFDQLFAWKRAQYRATGQTDVFSKAWARRLMETLFTMREPEFGGALFTLHVGDRLIAAQFNLRSRDVLHAWMVAHDDDLGRYSPGLLMFAEVLRWAPEAGFREFDMGSGEYRFKRSLSNYQRQVAGGFVGLPSPAALVRAAEYGVCKVAEALPLGKVSELPAKLMRRLDLIKGLG